MDSILKVLVKKKHPEYTEEEVWEETWKFCEGNLQKICSFLNRYSYASVTEPFDRLRKQTMSVIHNSDNYEMQRMLRDITTFETGMLFLLADEAAREQLTRNLTKRLEIIIGGEAYIAARKLSPGEKEFAAVLGKVMGVFFSEDMLEFKRERWECRHSFRVDQSLPLEKKKWILTDNLSMCNIACWSKAYEPLQARVEEYLYHEYEFEKRREIADLMYDGLYEKGLQTAYDFSRSGKGRISVMFSGLCFGEKEEIVFLTYLVRDDGMKKAIYRFTHELSTFPELDEVKMNGDTLEEVTEEELLRFCRSLYGRQYDV